MPKDFSACSASSAFNVAALRVRAVTSLRMDVREFDFDLPSELIAQEPAAERGAGRLLCLGRDTGAVTHTSFVALPDLLRGGDLLVVNNTRVFPARLLGHRVPTGGAVECLLVAKARAETTPAQANEQYWEALMHPGQKLLPGAEVIFEGTRTVHGEVIERRFHGRRLIRLWAEDGISVDQAVDAIGHVPLPPYIKRRDRSDDRNRYQTMFARERGSIAAPTAGLFPPGWLSPARSPFTSAMELFSRSASTASKTIGSNGSATTSARRPRPKSTALSPAVGASSLSAQPRPARSKRWRARARAGSWQAADRRICSFFQDSIFAWYVASSRIFTCLDRPF